jgi:putative endonuclease
VSIAGRSPPWPGLTRPSKYDLKRLVYAEWHDDILRAKQREMNIKHWRRAWKVQLIHRDNPFWEDLYDRLG